MTMAGMSSKSHARPCFFIFHFSSLFFEVLYVYYFVCHLCSCSYLVWPGGVAVRRRIRDREVASSTARCNSGQVVHTRVVPLFTKQYKLVSASAGGKVHHSSGVGYAGSHSTDFMVGGQPAPLKHRSYLWLPLYSGPEVTSVTYAAI